MTANTINDNINELDRLLESPQELIKLVYFVLSSNVFVQTVNGKFAIPKVNAQNLTDVAQDSLEYIIRRKKDYEPSRGSVSTWIKYCVFYVCQRRYNFYNNSVYMPKDFRNFSEIPEEREMDELGWWSTDFNQITTYDSDVITNCDINLMLEKISRMNKKTQDSLFAGTEDYGINLAEVGKKYGLSRESIRTERNKAIAKLKKKFNSN